MDEGQRVNVIEGSPPVPGVSGGPGHRWWTDTAGPPAYHVLPTPPLLRHSEGLLHFVG